MEKKCNKCGYKNNKCTEIRGVGLCKSCGTELYIINKKILKSKKEGR